MHLFTKCAISTFEMVKITEEQIFEFANKVNALDIDKIEDHYIVYFPLKILVNRMLEKFTLSLKMK